MTRALKILAITVLAVLCQTNLSSFLRLQSIAPDLMIAALVTLGFHYGTYGGFCAGAIMGLLYDAAVGYVLALNIIIYTFIGYAAPAGKALLQNRFGKRRYHRWLQAMALGFAMTLIREFTDIGYLFLIGAQQGLVTLLRMVLCCGYTAVWTLPVLLAVDRILRVPKKEVSPV